VTRQRTAAATAALAAIAAAALVATPARGRTLGFTASEATTLAAVAETAYGRGPAGAVLATANNLAPDAAIAVGQTVQVPVSYTVQVTRGMPLAVLARKYLPGRDRSALLAAVNNLKADEQLRPRSSVVVPALIWHVAQAGDSMRAISRTYYRNADGRWLLRRVNGNRNSDKVEPGERILVPIFAPWSDSEAVASRLRIAKSALAAGRDDGAGDESSLADSAPAGNLPPDESDAPQTPAAVVEKTAVNSASVAAAAQAQVIADGVELFRRGDYLAAVAYFRRSLLEPTLEPAQRVAADVWLASCYVAVDEPERAEEAMRAALRLSPELELDPALTSPKILHVLETVRQRMAPADGVPD